MGPEGTEVEITIKIANCLNVQTAPFQVLLPGFFSPRLYFLFFPRLYFLLNVENVPFQGYILDIYIIVCVSMRVCERERVHACECIHHAGTAV